METAGLISFLETIAGYAGSPLIFVPLTLMLAIAGALLAHRLGYALLRRFTNGDGDVRHIVERASGVLRLALILFALAAVLPVIPMDRERTALVQALLRIGVMTAFGWAGIVMINSIAAMMSRRYRIDVADNLAARRMHTQIGVLSSTATVIVVLITSGVIMMSFEAVRAYGVSLFASAGAAGLVLGFAARPILSNLIAGIQIALTQPIRIDDVVIVEGEWGRIEEITTTYVVIRIWDLRRLVVPLSYFIEQPFQNWTRESASILGTVEWRLDYTAPIAVMREKLSELLAAHPRWDRKVAGLQVTESDATTILVRGLMSAGNAGDAWDLRCDIREQMLVWLQQAHPESLPRMRAELSGEALRDRNGRAGAGMD